MATVRARQRLAASTRAAELRSKCSKEDLIVQLVQMERQYKQRNDEKEVLEAEITRLHEAKGSDEKISELIRLRAVALMKVCRDVETALQEGLREMGDTTPLPSACPEDLEAKDIEGSTIIAIHESLMQLTGKVMDVALAGKATMEKSGSEAQQQMQELKKANATLRQRLQEEEAELAKTKQNLSAFQHKTTTLLEDFSTVKNEFLVDLEEAITMTDNHCAALSLFAQKMRQKINAAFGYAPLDIENLCTTFAANVQDIFTKEVASLKQRFDAKVAQYATEPQVEAGRAQPWKLLTPGTATAARPTSPATPPSSRRNHSSALPVTPATVAKAVEDGDVGAVLSMLDKGWPLERSFETNGGAATALSVAAEKGSAALCEELLRRGADGNAPMALTPPLVLAAAGGHHHVCDVLLRFGAVRGLAAALEVAAQQGDLAVTRTLLQRIDPGARNPGLVARAQKAAANGGHSAVVEELEQWRLSGKRDEEREDGPPHVPLRVRRPLSKQEALERTPLTALVSEECPTLSDSESCEPTPFLTHSESQDNLLATLHATRN